MQAGVFHIALPLSAVIVAGTLPGRIFLVGHVVHRCGIDSAQGLRYSRFYLTALFTGKEKHASDVGP